MDERLTKVVDEIRVHMRGTDRNSLATVESAERMERAIAVHLQHEQLEGAAVAILELCVQTKSMLDGQPCSHEQYRAVQLTSNVHATTAVLLLDRAAGR